MKKSIITSEHSKEYKPNYGKYIAGCDPYLDETKPKNFINKIKKLLGLNYKSKTCEISLFLYDGQNYTKLCFCHL